MRSLLYGPQVLTRRPFRLASSSTKSRIMARLPRATVPQTAGPYLAGYHISRAYIYIICP